MSKDDRTETLFEMVDEIDKCGRGLNHFELRFMLRMLNHPPKVIGTEDEKMIKSIYKKRVSNEHVLGSNEKGNG